MKQLQLLATELDSEASALVFRHVAQAVGVTSKFDILQHCCLAYPT